MIRSHLKISAAAFAIIAGSAAHSASLFETDVFTAPTKATQLAYSATGGTLLVKNSASAIKVVNTATKNVISTQTANTVFVDMSMTPSGRYVYAADYGGENTGYGTPASPNYVHRYDTVTGTWQVKSAYIAGGIEAVSDNRFLLQALDQWVGIDLDDWGTGSAVTRVGGSSTYLYSGSMVYDRTDGRVIHGNSGSSSQELRAMKVNANNLVAQEGSGIYGSAQGHGGTLVMATDDSVVYYGNLQVEALDVSHNLRSFPELIFAATGDLAFGGSGNYYDAHSGLLLGNLGFAASVYGLDQSGQSFWAFNSVDNTLHRFSTVNPVPVPAAAWLMGSALTGLAAFGRKRKTA